MSILEEICAAKRHEVARRKTAVSVPDLEASLYFSSPCRSMARALRQSPAGVIAEIKRKSPSKGILNLRDSISDLARGYADAGAAGISVLTDLPYFGGQREDIGEAREATPTPLLRKEFILDEYQVLETKAIGADLILLIAAALDPVELKLLARLARSVGLETLLEVHGSDEIDACLCDDIDLVGVNSRNLGDLSMDPDRAFELATRIPDGFVRVAESGLNDAAQVLALRKVGYRGFLIGESFMSTPHPGGACKAFIASLEAER